MATPRIAREQVEAALNSAPTMLTVAEISEFCRRSERQARRWISEQRLPAVRTGARNFLVPKSALINFLCGGA